MGTESTDRTADSELRKTCEAGTLRLYGTDSAANVRERLEHELALIEELGWARGFLTVLATVRAIRDIGVPIGSTPGSSAGSFAYYVLGVTDVDPLEHDLLFERFLLEHDGVLKFTVDIPFRRLNLVAAALGAPPVSTSVCRIEADGVTIGIRGLEVLDRNEATLAKVSAEGGPVLRLADIPADDPQTYDLLCSGSNFGAYWFDTLSARRMLRDLHPRTLDQLAVAFAINRSYFPAQAQAQDLMKRVRGRTWGLGARHSPTSRAQRAASSSSRSR